MSEAIRAEIEDWYFRQYLPDWIHAFSTGDPSSASFITTYWHAPILINDGGASGPIQLDTRSDLIKMTAAEIERLAGLGFKSSKP